MRCHIFLCTACYHSQQGPSYDAHTMVADRKERFEAFLRRMIPNAPNVGKCSPGGPRECFQDDGEWENSQDALPSPAHVCVSSRCAVRIVPQITWRPRQADCSKTLNGDDVHPLFEIHFRSVERSQLLNDLLQDRVYSMFVPFDVVGVVDGPNKASLQAITLHITLSQEIKSVWRLKTELCVKLWLEESRGYCGKASGMNHWLDIWEGRG